MRIKFLKLAFSKNYELKQNLRLFKTFLLRGIFVLGKDVEKFEKKISTYINKKYTDIYAQYEIVACRCNLRFGL